jgi:hypothetical protein
MNIQEAMATFRSHRAQLEEAGVGWQPGAEVQGYFPPEFKRNYSMAKDAAIPLLTTDPNSGVPALLTTLIDPQVYEVLFAPNKAAEILGENRKGTWLDQTAMFPVAEATGEVSSYGDFSENGRAGVNTNWPQRQSYLFQLIKEYGELELERAGLARINWVSEIDKAAALNLNKFTNFTYFFGVAGLQNYGLLNDPNLSAAITPATKAVGGTAWIVSGALNATANEIYADIEAIYFRLVAQTGGLVARDAAMTLALSPASEAAMTATNSFNVNVSDLLKKNFPNMKVISAVQYGVTAAGNTQGNAAGNLVQLIVNEVEGQQTGFCAFNEKMRAHPIIRAVSSFKQKMTGGSWGTVLRFPAGIAQMVGV